MIDDRSRTTSRWVRPGPDVLSYFLGEDVHLPDLSQYRLHRIADDAELDGVRVPGLRAEFFRRAQDGRLASVGRYHYRGRELLLAWGYVDEPHCRYSAVRDEDGSWSDPVPGCPEVRTCGPDGQVTGLAVRDARGRWVGERSSAVEPS
jgi:hypothetical protein